jgi:hypothetical protein
LPPPTPTLVTATIARTKRYTSTTVRAELADAPPADAIGVIAYDRDGHAIDFARVDADARAAKQINIHDDPGRCRFPPKGVAAPQSGDAVTLAWVDRFGRVSKQSKPIQVESPKE